MEGSDQDQRGLHLLTACLLALQGKKYNIYIYIDIYRTWKFENKNMNNVSGTRTSATLVGTPHGPSGG